MDPRISRTQQTVMAAATELLVEGGPDALTVDGVVARSGVAKSTIYRHWATRDDLVAEVFDQCAPQLELPSEDQGFESSLRQLIRGVVATFADERWRRLMPALMLLQAQHQDLAGINSRLEKQQHVVFTAVLRRGVDEGLLPAEVAEDVDRAAAMLAGPILMAALSDGVELDERLADESVDQFLAAHRRC